MSEKSARLLLEVDRTIHEPARLTVVAILSAVKEADFLYLLQATGLTKGNLSSHLAKLERAGYIAITKMFIGKTPRTVCQLTDAGRDAFAAYRKQMQAIFADS